MRSPLSFAGFAASFRPNPTGDGTTMRASVAGVMGCVDDACMSRATGVQDHRPTDGTSFTMMHVVSDGVLTFGAQ